MNQEWTILIQHLFILVYSFQHSLIRY